MPLLTAVMLFTVGLVTLTFSAVAFVTALRTDKTIRNIDWLLVTLGVGSLIIGGFLVWITYQYV